MPQNRIYRPMVQIARKYAILSAFICAGFGLFGQSEADYIRKLPKDTTITTPFNDMVLMSLPVFSEYYFAKSNYEILAATIPQYQAMVDSVDLLRARNRADLDSVQLTTRSIIELERGSKEQAVGEVIRLTNKLNKEARKTKILKYVAAGALAVAIIK